MINLINTDESMMKLPQIIKEEIIEIIYRYINNLPPYLFILGKKQK